MLSTPSQLSLFPNSLERTDLTNFPALLLLACSGTKLDRPARAIDLYQGVMYRSYRAHLRSDAAPHVLILSARHGFLDPHTAIAPYDECMTPQRAEQMLADLLSSAHGLAPASRQGDTGRGAAISPRHARRADSSL
ncbi:DUF6884 domain-containing protein [Cupriavidus pinatubonensis]